MVVVDVEESTGGEASDAEELTGVGAAAGSDIVDELQSIGRCGRQCSQQHTRDAFPKQLVLITLPKLN